MSNLNLVLKEYVFFFCLISTMKANNKYAPDRFSATTTTQCFKGTPP